MLPHDVYINEVRQQYLYDAEQYRLARAAMEDMPSLGSRLADWVTARVSAANPPRISAQPQPAARPTTLSARIR